MTWQDGVSWAQDREKLAWLVESWCKHVPRGIAPFSREYRFLHTFEVLLKHWDDPLAPCIAMGYSPALGIEPYAIVRLSGILGSLVKTLGCPDSKDEEINAWAWRTFLCRALLEEMSK